MKTNLLMSSGDAQKFWEGGEMAGKKRKNGGGGGSRMENGEVLSLPTTETNGGQKWTQPAQNQHAARGVNEPIRTLSGHPLDSKEQSACAIYVHPDPDLQMLIGLWSSFDLKTRKTIIQLVDLFRELQGNP